VRQASTQEEFMEALPKMLRLTKRLHPNNLKTRGKLNFIRRTVQFVCRGCGKPVRVGTIALLYDAMAIQEEGGNPFDWSQYQDISVIKGSHFSDWHCDACRCNRGYGGYRLCVTYSQGT
jgi:hypothetical protein